jgi:hypothetical protein
MSSILAALLLAGSGVQADEPLRPWRGKVTPRPLLPDLKAHALHAYYLASPESPDGRWVLFYVSTTPEGYEGELRALERATGRVRTLSRKLIVEDAHRAACQQWLSGGRRVAFHDFRGGEWVVACVDLESQEERVLARGRQVGFGSPRSDILPLYGPHGNPGERRGLELLNVETGEIRTVLTPVAVRQAYPDWVSKAYGDRPISVFFPVLSPDATRVFFKLASPLPSDADPASPDHFRRPASDRKGLFVYDLDAGRLAWAQPRAWGHPAWHPDSKQILQMHHLLIDAGTGASRSLPDLPRLPGSPHPSAAPDGALFATDFSPPLDAPEKKGFWSVLVGDLRGKDSVVIHSFDLSGGARSWRRPHPHPVFSPDGKRLYFHATAAGWTQLHVAEAAP